MITVYVKLFATLRQRLPNLGIGEKRALSLPAGATVGQLLLHLKLPADLVKIVFVNHRIQGEDYPLSDGDVVGIFPPVGGG